MKPLNAEIIRLYTVELKSADEISDMLAFKGTNMAPEIIRYRLRSYGVVLRKTTPRRPSNKTDPGEERYRERESRAQPQYRPVFARLDYGFPPHIQAQFEAHLRQVRMERAWA